MRDLAGGFAGEYWRRLDRTQAYPTEFVEALTAQGWLAVLIPAEFEGGGLGITEAAIVLEEINRSGGSAAGCHAQLYTLAALLRHGSGEQKRAYLPGLARGELRLQAFGVTEPDAGSDTLAIRTSARRVGAGWVISGEKVFTSRVESSDLMLLLARTSEPRADDRTHGLSLFLIDLREATGLTWSRMDLMINHPSYAVRLDEVRVPAGALVGEEGRGFRHVLDGWNAERILLASEAVGDGRWFVERAARYATERQVFGRPIGANQGVQFPIAQAHAQVEAASLVRWQAAARFDAGLGSGAEANLAKLLASQASWAAANACLGAHGGYGFARDYDVERKFRETKLLEIAPVSNNLVLAYLSHQVLGMPRSY